MNTVPYENLANVPAERPPTFPVGDPLFVTPRISWPTVGLFVGGLAVWALAIACSASVAAQSPPITPTIHARSVPASIVR